MFGRSGTLGAKRADEGAMPLSAEAQRAAASHGTGAAARAALAARRRSLDGSV